MLTSLRRSLRNSAKAVVSAILAVATVQPVSGQEPAPAVVLERLEQLERQNRELEAQVEKKLREAQSAVSADGVDARTVEGIVAGYLQRQAEAKKKEETKKNEFVEVGSDLSMKATWRDGVGFASPNNDFKFHFGGRLQLDMGCFDETDTFPIFDDAVGFRRARLKADGTMWEVFDWVAEIDFSNNGGVADRATFTDVYVEFTQLPRVGNLRVGRFKEPVAFEELISDNYISLMERSSAAQVFVPSRNLGAMLHRTWGDQQRATSAVGLFRDDTGESIDPAKGDGGFGQGEAEYAIDARLTYLPVWEHDGRCLVHVGGSYSWRNFNANIDASNNRPRLRAQAPIRLGTPFLLDTGIIADVEGENLWAGELAAQRGPLNFQSDIYLCQFNRQAKDGGELSSPLYWGGYAQVGYFLTGEHRPYKRSAGVFDRVRPIENFFFVRGEDGGLSRGLGAWEVVARYGYLDLHSSGFATDPSDVTRAGGTGVQQDITLGVNWYLNPNMKWQFNWVRAYRDSDGGPDFDGHVDIWAARLVVDF